MSTAIVILNWNGENFIRQFLKVLIENTTMPGVEIIVADNASTDSSLMLLNDKFPSIRTILLDKNYGFAGGYNKAFEQIEADYFILLNSDVEVTPHWLEPLLAYMNAHKEVAACQPKILSFDQRTHFEHAGAAGGYIDRYGFPFCRGRIVDHAEKDIAQYDSITDIFWATGACLMIRSDIFRQVGRLDNEFFAHMEEIDLCWRIKSRGYRIVCIPESYVYHVGGGALGYDSPHKIYLNFRNNLLMLYKNLPAGLLRKTMFLRSLFDYSAAINYILTGKFDYAKSIFKARRDFSTMQPDFEEKRKQNMLLTTTDLKSEIFQGSIVLEYYLKRKRTFNSIVSK